MNKIIFATGNEGKAREVRKIFGDGFEILTLRDLKDDTEIVEDGNTFEANAKIKAEAIYDKYKLPVISDDSGLAVEHLDGEPGVHSARYAGRHAGDLDNNLKLLKELKEHPKPHRAKFVCCAIYYEGKSFTAALGEVPGEIIKEPRGSNGFGYDPLFIPDGYDKTMAELELDEKNKISHRSRAFNKLRELINR